MVCCWVAPAPGLLSTLTGTKFLAVTVIFSNGFEVKAAADALASPLVVSLGVDFAVSEAFCVVVLT